MSNEDLAACSLLFSGLEVVVRSKWRETPEMPEIADRVAIVVDKAN